MRWGVGIDASLGLTFEESGTLVREAAALGFTSAWCPSGPATRDGFQVCGQWARDTFDLPGFQCGIAVIPAPVWSVPSLVSQAGSVGALSGGRFILGFGTGGNYSSEFRASYGLPETPNVALMRDYLVTVRGLLNGETVTHQGKAVTLQGLRMAGKPLPVPLYISALGPQLLRLAGELADGVCLNWATPAQRQWCRDRIAEGAARSGRDPSQVVLMEYIRVCIDEDEAKARHGFASAIMGYALSRAGAAQDRGYRGHFARMGFDEMLTDIEAKRDAGASADEMADAFPGEFLRQMGYFGPAAGAQEAIKSLSEGLDVPVVRIVGTSPGLDAARRTVEACAP
jgi:alkanesulfonate monooxygenase SsuD/methylene tetrahydromethanopterin reductase-like flavin-dependent oxidoreductase (luciferase family)